MKLKFYFLFTFFTFFFLFYPGDTYYFKIFAYNRDFFAKTENRINIQINPIPVIKNHALLNLSAEGVYIADLPSFTPLFEKNARMLFYPASTTKIITALTVYDLYTPNQIITVTKTSDEGQVMGLVQGEKISVENLLYGLLVHSANDAAFTFSNDYGNSQFINLMNIKAKNLKMKNTSFKNPAGLDEPGQYTTAFDLAIAARALLKNDYLSKFVATKEITIADVDFKYFHKLDNVNKLLGEIQGIGGLKTGYTENAGENLVSFYKKDGHKFVIVILKSKDRFEDTKQAVKWINENIEYVNYSVRNSSVNAGT